MEEHQAIHHVPRARHAFDLKMKDGAIIHVRQHGIPGGPRLMFSHGNGLAIDGYFPFWGPLRNRYEVVVFDFRNHGHNPLHTAEGHTWQNFIEDLDAVWQGVNQELGVKPVAGLFHSLSGVTAAMHALKYGPRFDALVLFDPPVYPREGHPFQYPQTSDKNSLASRAARRPERYKDPMDLARQFAKRFPRWRPEAYELMARATLRHDHASGDWILACPREYEAHVFSTNADPQLWLKMANCPVPVKLICGDPTLEEVGPPALIGRAMAEELGLPYEAINGTSHFLQIERPEECASAVESFLADHGLAAPGVVV
jgi:pimeloyl-ACP methyl ester carboxylesterase